MNVIPLPISRISSQYQGSFMLSTLQSGQLDLLKVQSQMATGNRLIQASDDPAAATSIERLKQQLAQNDQTKTSLAFASGFLGTADNALASVITQLGQAQSAASSMVSSTNSADARKAQATVVDNIINTIANLANSRYQGAAVFGGANGIDDPFKATAGGYLYQGSTQGQSMLLDNGQSLAYTVDGNAIFGGQSAQVVGYQNLTPGLAPTTRLVDLGGQRGKGVTPGPITITSGATTLHVDLSGAATVGDVVNTIQTALTGAGISANIIRSNTGFRIANTGGTSLTIADDSGATAAADLGLNTTVGSGAVVLTPSTHPRLMSTTPLQALRGWGGVDPAGFTITNGQQTATIQMSGLTTVQDLLNGINNSGTQVRAEINAANDGINVFNNLSGTELRIGENGGQTADQLGLRSFQANTLLSEFNGGQGMAPIGQQSTTVPVTGHVTITRTDGSNFSIDMTGTKSAADILNRINNAPGNSTVTAVMSPTGNGLTLIDTSGGGGNLTLSAGSDFQPNGSTLNLLGAGTGGSFATGNMTFNTDDVKITRRDGSWFTVNFSGLTNVQGVIAAIRNAPGNTNPATQMQASLNAVGNGIQLADPTAPATPGAVLQVQALNASSAPGQLGLLQVPGSLTPGVVNGADVNGLMPRGVLSSLTLLREALNNNDTAGIQRAATLLNQDYKNVSAFHGQVGARQQDVASRQDQNTNDQLALKQSLSLLNDTDMTAAITQFQALQTAYSASLKAAAATQNLSLLDFLK